MSAGAAAIAIRRRRHRRSPGAAILAAVAGLVLLLSIVGGLSAGSTSSTTYTPSAEAIADIPGNYLVAYQRAAMTYGLDWAVLAAVGKVECDHGRYQAAGCNPLGSLNAAGATGPMQFLGPTWRRGVALGTVPAIGPPTLATSAGYAADGDADGLADVWNPFDAIAGAARLLRANGAPDDYRTALYAYNHAGWYVDNVLTQAGAYRGAFAPTATAGARAVLAWALAHVGRYSYSQEATTDRGASVGYMQTHEPAGTTCDCSMFVRWAMAQAGLDVGWTTVDQWYAAGLLPNTEKAAATPAVIRGVGSAPPQGGYQPADMIFFGHGGGDDGHVALYLGDGQVVQCSSSGDGSNIRALAGYVEPTGWLRWSLAAT